MSYYRTNLEKGVHPGRSPENLTPSSFLSATSIVEGGSHDVLLKDKAAAR